MARTQLFARLSSLLAATRSADAQAAGPALTRRAFVQRSLLGLAALSQLRSVSACSEESESPLGSDARIAIVGAGMAGLTCAYRLKQAGVLASVYDAATRTGGRMFSRREGFLDDQVGELGGEFIDTNHLTMHALAEELAIELEDREAALQADITREIWWVDGQAIPEATIVEQFKRVAPRMAQLVEQADDESDDSVFRELDQTSLADWLEANLTSEPELKSVLRSAYRGEYGREPEQQSVLNLLYLVGSDEPEPFRIFGVSDERFHAKGGSQTFTDKLTSALGAQLSLGHRLSALRGDARRGYVLTFAVEGASEPLEVSADVVVLALPFTLLRRVDLSQLTLSDDKRTMIEELGYGTNVKVMGAFTQRPWRDGHLSSGSVTADEPFQQLWDTSLSQAGQAGLLTNFLGGAQGEAAGQGSAEEWYQGVVLPGLDAVYGAGTRDSYQADSAVRMHWPSHPLTLGSYACYLPGQWAFWGSEGLPENNDTLHFCGEHTSLDFQGYMEGAADSGSLVASALLDKLGIAASAQHQALTRVRRGVAQPYFQERSTARGLRARRRQLKQLALRLYQLGSHAA